MLDISSQILLPLSRANEVIVDKRYRGVKKPDGLRCDCLGLGSMSTWHGTPDMRVKGAEVVVESVDKGDEIDVHSILTNKHSYQLFLSIETSFGCVCTIVKRMFY